jgi:hypothetical protein
MPTPSPQPPPDRTQPPPPLEPFAGWGLVAMLVGIAGGAAAVLWYLWAHGW